jgi:hypothetical protein
MENNIVEVIELEFEDVSDTKQLFTAVMVGTVDKNEWPAHIRAMIDSAMSNKKLRVTLEIID